MNAKQRKPLNDTLAEQFVFGETTATTSTSPIGESAASVNGEPSIVANPAGTPAEREGNGTNWIEQLTIERKEPTVRLTVDLPQSTHRKLSILSANTGRKKAEIVRLLLDDVLKEVN